MALPHERIRDGIIDLPAEDELCWVNGFTWPTNFHQFLINNATHQAVESYRQLISDDIEILYDLGDKTSTWGGLIDVESPSDAEIAAADADYKKVSWAPDYTRSYFLGPGIADRTTADGRTVMRRLRGHIRVAGNSLSPTYDTLVVWVLTTHSSPELINQGQVLAAGSHNFVGAITATDLDVDFSPDTPDRQSSAYLCRSPSTTGGPVQFFGTPLYFWVCCSSRDGAFISRVFLYEAP